MPSRPTKVLIVTTAQPSIARSWGDAAVVSEVRSILDEGRPAGGGGACRYHRGTYGNWSRSRHLTLHFRNGYWLLGSQPRRSLPEALVSLGVPTLGYDVTSFVTTSKGAIKERLRAAGISTPDWSLFEPGGPMPDLEFLGMPLVVKPDEGAESISTHRLDGADSVQGVIMDLAEAHGQPVLVERWSRDREFTVSVLGNGQERHVLPLEITLPPDLQYLSTNAKKHRMQETIRPIQDSGPGRAGAHHAQGLRSVRNPRMGREWSSCRTATASSTSST